MNVFKKCLRNEFGQTDYRRYFSMCQEEMQKIDLFGEIRVKDKEVYQDMMKHIRELRPEEIAQKKEILSNTLVESFRIGRHFWFVFLFYIMASLVLIALELDPTVTNVSLLLIGICFLYKTYEFVCNKYCFVDAYMIMLYQSALEHVSD